LDTANLKALRIDLQKGDYWWSTRLFFLACIADSLTATQLFIFLEDGDQFLGVATPATVRDRIGRSSHLLRDFDQLCQNQPVSQHNLDKAIDERAMAWDKIFRDANTQEDNVRTTVSRRDLRRWLGDDLVERSIEQEESVQTAGYLRAFLDWPYAVVPVTSGGKLKTIVDHAALTKHLANLYVRDVSFWSRQGRP
jgi:hypothetical protein